MSSHDRRHQSGEFLNGCPASISRPSPTTCRFSVRDRGGQHRAEFRRDAASQHDAEAASRAFEVQYASAADIARVEIRKVPLPRTAPCPRRFNQSHPSFAFEFSKRRIDYRFLFMSEPRRSRCAIWMGQGPRRKSLRRTGKSSGRPVSRPSASHHLWAEQHRVNTHWCSVGEFRQHRPTTPQRRPRLPPAGPIISEHLHASGEASPAT